MAMLKSWQSLISLYALEMTIVNEGTINCNRSSCHFKQYCQTAVKGVALFLEKQSNLELLWMLHYAVQSQSSTTVVVSHYGILALFIETAHHMSTK